MSDESKKFHGVRHTCIRDDWETWDAWSAETCPACFLGATSGDGGWTPTKLQEFWDKANHKWERPSGTDGIPVVYNWTVMPYLRPSVRIVGIVNGKGVIPSAVLDQNGRPIPLESPEQARDFVPVVEALGPVITTVSGSRYVLGPKAR